MANKAELFQEGRRIEHEARVGVRPLGALSDYVVEQMPYDLNAVRSGKMTGAQLAKLSFLPPSLSLELVERVHDDSNLSDTAGLDLKMLESAIVHSGGIPPEPLMRAVDAFATRNGQISGLTYEEIVLLNPDTDPRTFTTGEEAASEHDFYRGHKFMEEHLANGVNAIDEVRIILMSGGNESTVAELLRGTAGELKDVVTFMGKYRTSFNIDHFAAFRPYVSTHPIRDLKGPSGAFTALVPELDLILSGEVMADVHRPYVEENIQYFPREGQKRLKRALDDVTAGYTVTNLLDINGNPPELVAGVQDIANQLRVFRGAHYGAVKHHIPQALSGSEKGTAGSEVQQFLGDRISRTKELIQNLK